MVNMFGAGNAYGLRYARRSYMPTQVRMFTPKPTGNIFGGHSCCGGTTNITVNNGPTGFWGFMGGLFNGLFGGGMGMGGMFGGFGNMFGMGGMFGGFGNMFGLGGMGMGYPALNGAMGGLGGLGGTTGTGTAQEKTAQQKLADLNKLYPGYNFTLGDGEKFSATKTDKEGKTKQIGINLSYDDMLAALKADNEETQGTGRRTDGTTTTTTDGTTTTTTGGTTTTTTGGTTTTTTDGTTTTTTGGTTTTTTGGTTTTTTDGTTTSRTGGGGGRTINGVKQNLNGWYKYSSGGEKAAIDKLRQANGGKPTAAQVVDTVLKGKMDYLGASDRANLVNLMIANNPSVFNSDGTVKDNANWDKLDIPSAAALKNRYVDGNAKYDQRTGNVSYRSRSGEDVSTRSNVNDNNRNIVRGNNGYWVDMSGSKPVYHKPDGSVTTKQDFDNHCPNIGKSVDKRSSNIARGNNGYWVDMNGSKPVYHKPDGSITTKQDFDKHCPNIGKSVDRRYS